MATTRQLIITALMARLESYSWTATGPADFVLGPADPTQVDFPIVQLIPGQESIRRQDYGADMQTALAFTASVYISLDQMTKAADEILEEAFVELKACLFATPLTVTEDGVEHSLSLTYEQGAVDYDYDVGPGFAGAGVQFTITINESIT